jgi:hypothetical protein
MWWKYYVLIYGNGNRPVETILRIGGGKIKENDEVG